MTVSRTCCTAGVNSTRYDGPPGGWVLTRMSRAGGKRSSSFSGGARRGRGGGSGGRVRRRRRVESSVFIEISDGAATRRGGLAAAANARRCGTGNERPRRLGRARGERGGRVQLHR